VGVINPTLPDPQKGWQYKTKNVKDLLKGQRSTWFDAIKPDLSPKHKGRFAEAAVLQRLAGLGLDVSNPVFDNDVSDWVVKIKPRMLRVIQVRCISWTKHGAPILRLVRTMATGNKIITERLTADEFDFMVGYDIVTDSAFVYTAAELVNNTTAKSVTCDAKEAWHKLFL
jgi:hypothetical protein